MLRGPARLLGSAQPHAAIPAAGVMPPCAPPADPGAVSLPAAVSPPRCAPTLQSWDTAMGCVLGHMGKKVLAGIRAPRHLRAEAAGKAALFLGCSVLLDLPLVPSSSQGTHNSGHPVDLPTGSMGRGGWGEAWDAQLQLVTGAWWPWCPWCPCRSQLPAPHQLWPWPPCPQVMWAATREGSAAVSSHGKPITLLPGSPRGSTCPRPDPFGCVLPLPGTTGHG